MIDGTVLSSGTMLFLLQGVHYNGSADCGAAAPDPLRAGNAHGSVNGSHAPVFAGVYDY